MTVSNTQWTFPAGFIPEQSTGHEPENTSRNVLCLLNPGPAQGCAKIVVYHEDRDPVGPYLITLPAERVRHIRINDLIDPQAVPLGSPYGLALTSDVPISVQLVYVDTSEGRFAVTSLPGIPGP